MDIFDPRTWEDPPATRRVYLTPCAETYAVIDAADWPLISSFGIWQLHFCGKGKYYAKSEKHNGGTRERVYMHRLIAGLRIRQPRKRGEKTPLVDHMDGDGLNNTTDNLRWATHVQNVRNVHGRAARMRLAARNAETSASA